MAAGREQPAGKAVQTALSLDLADEDATAGLATQLAPLAGRGDVIALSGDLGTGKTSFCRAFLRALGYTGEVPSPTFTLVQTYDFDPLPVWHFDMYRLASPDDVFETGIEDAFAEAVSLIEWPEILGPLLPRDRLDIRFEFAGDTDARRVVLTGHGSWAARLDALAPGTA